MTKKFKVRVGNFCKIYYRDIGVQTGIVVDKIDNDFRVFIPATDRTDIFQSKDVVVTNKSIDIPNI